MGLLPFCPWYFDVSGVSVWGESIYVFLDFWRNDEVGRHMFFFFSPLKKLMNLGRKPFPMTTTSPRDIQKHRLVFLMLGLDPTSQLNASIYSPRWMNFWRPQTFARPTCKRDLTKIMRCLMVDDRWWPTFPTIQKTSKEMDYKKWWITCNN